MNEEERKELQKFWITGPAFVNAQEKDTTLEATQEGQDISQNWHLRNVGGQQSQPDLKSFQLQSMNQAHKEVLDQTYKESQRDAHRLGTTIQKRSEKPWVELSHNEQAYL